MLFLFSTKIVVIVSSKCSVFLKMTTMLGISTTTLIQAPVCTISVEVTLVLNPWCFGTRVVYVHTPGTYPAQCKTIHDSLSLLPKLKKGQETWSNILHMVTYCPTFRACTSLTQVHYVPKGTQEHNALV